MKQTGQSVKLELIITRSLQSITVFFPTEITVYPRLISYYALFDFMPLDALKSQQGIYVALVPQQ